MKTALKICGLLTTFFLVLCVSVKEKPIFEHIYAVIAPGTKSVQQATEDFFERSFASTQDYSKKLFDNSVPRVKADVRSKLSSTLRAAASAEPAEKISEKEREQLSDLIKNHRD